MRDGTVFIIAVSQSRFFEVPADCDRPCALILLCGFILLFSTMDGNTGPEIRDFADCRYLIADYYCVVDRGRKTR